MEVDFLRFAKEIAYYHQERWDGSGYPDGLGGDDIPIPARLMAVADVYDALVSRRVYKAAMPHERAVEIVLAGVAPISIPTSSTLSLPWETRSGPSPPASSTAKRR
jgi:response regulator RpfG family c-di-GMP phosphodiesterase